MSATALGVRKREDSLRQNSTDPKNFGTIPKSAKEHADDLGVTERTVENWEKDRKEIMADPELAAMAQTLEGHQEAKKILNERQADQKVPIKVAKQMQSALKKWESLNPQDAEVVLELLLRTDFYDRT